MSREVCLTELKKIIKDYNVEFERFLAEDARNCSAIVYVDKEKEMLKDNNYSFYGNLTRMMELSGKIAEYTSVLNKTNAVTYLESKNFIGTISDALTKVKYANKMINSLEQKLVGIRNSTFLSFDKQICKTIYLYEPETAKKELENLKETVRIIQMDIDRTNLSTFVEID